MTATRGGVARVRFGGIVAWGFALVAAAMAASGAGNHKWNLRENGDDRFHDNEPWLRPWRHNHDDGVGRWVGQWTYDVPWGGVSLAGEADGSVIIGRSRDHQFHLWTHVFVRDGKTITLGGSGDCVLTAFVNYQKGDGTFTYEGFDAPIGFPAKLDLQAGWNRVDVTGYNQNSGYTCTINGLAALVDLMNNEPIDLAPVAVIAPVAPVEQATADGTVVTLDGTGSHDPLGRPLSFFWTAPGIVFDDPTSPTPTATFPLGSTVVTLVVNNGEQDSDPTTTTVVVVDTTPPDITWPGDIVLEQETRGGTPLPCVCAATDICDADVPCVCDPPCGTVLPLGVHTVLCSATDDSGNTASVTFTVTVQDTTPPEITCPGGTVVEQETREGTQVFYECPATDICDADVLVVCVPPSGTVFPLGTTTVMCTATDDSGNVATCSFAITVADTTPPDLTVPDDIETEQTSLDGTPVDIGEATATDICDADVDITNDAPAVFPLGDTIVTWTATDDSGNSEAKTQTVTITDTTPPEIQSTWPVPAVLWPPDRTMRVVTVESILSDICDAAPTYAIIEVTSNEPVTGPGDNTQPDWIITGDHTVELRAERRPQGGGRIYTITIAATDASANVATAQVQVEVPLRPVGPLRLRKVGGDQQRGTPGTPLPEPLVVIVTDPGGNPVPNVPVEFDSDDGACDPPEAETDDDGEAATQYTPGNRNGAHQIRVSSPATNNVVTFIVHVRRGGGRGGR